MKRFYFSKLVILLVISLGLNLSVKAQCNCAYSYKVPITVTNLGSTALTNYQASITLNTAALVTAGSMQASGADIRFADASCTNLNYWIQSGMNTASTVIWIKVNSIPASGSATIYLYYGNPAATAASNGDSTFIFFDNFPGSSLNPAKWSITNGGGSGTVSSNTLTINTSSYYYITSVNSYPAPYYSEMNVTAASGNWPFVAQCDNNSYTSYPVMCLGGTTMYGSYWTNLPIESALSGNTAASGAVAGVWSLARNSVNTYMSWPSGTFNYTGSYATTTSPTEYFALGGLDGGTSSMTMTWVRLRQYYAPGTTQTVGAAGLNSVPPITGPTSVCALSNITLNNIAPVGTWSSSNTAAATVSSSGVVTGVAGGTAVISYVVTTGCVGTATYTVNVLPTAGSITGTTNVCTGFTTPLADPISGGTWISTNTAAANVSSSGVVSGLSSGITTISYTFSNGCTPATTTVTINTFPPPIRGTLSTCASGGTTTLSDALSGGSWNSTSPSVATIGVGSGIVTGITAGVTTISYTAPTGCVTSSAVTINQLPSPVSGASAVCVGSTTTLTNTLGGGVWTSSNTSQATVGLGTGIVTGVVAGTPGIIYTIPGTGCSASTIISVNPLPAAISGNNNVCVGSSTSLSDLGGGTWVSSNTSVATANAFSGSITGVSPGIATITYTLGTGCSATTSMLVNPVPAPYTLTGGGSYCAGGGGTRVGMAFAASGINYVLNLGGSAITLPVGGSNSGLNFGLQTGAGTYSVTGTNALTGCSASMTGSVTVSINPAPFQYNVTGGGGYCVGTTGTRVGTDGSASGINYQLYNDGIAVGPVVSGTGTALNFGSFTAVGTYTVLATNPLTGCSAWQTGSADISVTLAPTPYTVSGGGSYCAGGPGVNIFLNVGSDAGTLYQLFYGGVAYGSPVPGTGGPIGFGPDTTAGTYTVVATNGSGCTANMPGSATVIVDPVPAVNTVTGGGGYCAGAPGVHIGLTFSTPGVSYELIYAGGPVSTVGGSGAGLDFGPQTAGGTYTVIAVNSITGCSSNMAGSATVNMNPVPFVFNVSGGGTYCSGTTGIDITTDASQSGVSYQLFKGGVATGLPVPGDISGLGLDFGNHTSGSYTITASTTAGCSTLGTGRAVISANPLPAIHTVTGGGNYCLGGAGLHVGLSTSNTGIFYELMQSGGILTTLSGTGSALDFGSWPSGLFTVVAMDSASGCLNNMSGSATIGIDSLPAVNTVTGGGSYCAGGAGIAIGLDGSVAGISYQLSDGSGPAGAPFSGSGSALNFGMKTAAGTYTVLATNTLTGCTSAMSGNAIVNINALPLPQTISGGGNYCAGGPGADVNLPTSEPGVSYQLYRFGVPVGSPMIGAGTMVDFGMDTFGVYTVTAVNTGCSASMPGSITVTAISPVVYTVTGGGNYCPGGTGVHVGQSGSAIGVSYQLMSSGTGFGAALYGSGSSLNFGSITTPGTYTIQATDTTLGCSGNMAGSATVGIYLLPVAETVTGGGSFCAGLPGEHVGLAASANGVHYQLYNGSSPVGTVAAGTGAGVDFGLQSAGGIYTVRGTDVTTGCTNLMAGSATNTILPTPMPFGVTIDNFGNYCASDTGLHIWLSNSQSGDNYQLFRGSTVVGGTVSGTGTGVLDMGLQTTAGSYTVVGTNPANTCTADMLGSVVVNIVPLPTVHNVTGGGNFCPGGIGVPVGLDGSNVGIFYQLYKNGDSLTGTMYGTGAGFDFGLQQDPGNYTIVGNSEITFCQNNMLGTAVVATDSILTPSITLRAFPGTGVGVWHIDSMKAFVTNGGGDPTYQWYINGHLIEGATNATFTNYQFFTNDVVICKVTSSGPCGGKTTTSGALTITLSDVSVGQVSTAGADVKLVPNPNKGIFTVKGNLGVTADEEVTMEVTNMLGQVVYTGKVNAVNGSIDTRVDLGNTLANGMYIMSLGSGAQHTVFHFVIEQ